MRALLFDGNRLGEVRRPRPRSKQGEVIVRIHLAGICSTDLEIIRGYMDFHGVPGHEFVGTVVSGTSGKLEGKRVVGEINIPCKRCSICRLGLEKHCPNRSVIGISGRNGAFADYLSIPAENLHVVPGGISDEEAAFTEPLAAACEIPTRIEIGPASRVAVLGDGRLAALTSQVIALHTDNVVVLGLNPEKLSVIRGLGISTRNIAAKERFKREYDMVVECTGKPAGLPLAAELVRPRGTVVLKSTYSGRLSWNPASIVVDELTVTGSRCGPFDSALRLIALGKVKVTPLLTSIYRFDHWRKAFRKARRSESFKVLLDFT